MEVSKRINNPSQAEDDHFPAKSDNEYGNFEDRKMLQSNSGSLQFTDLPADVIHLILRKLKFGNIARLRLVSKYFNDVCSFLLDTEFNNLRTSMFQRFQSIKALMPRRESARRKHPLARESDIIETLHMRLSLLHMTFGKHIEKKYCCFFPGDIIDEIYRILQYIKHTPNLNRAYKVTDELFDLSTMAMEYFKEQIEPSLPEICFLTTNLLEHSSFIRPTTNWTIHKSQLLDIECSNAIKGILGSKPTINDPLIKLQEQLNKTNEIATQNTLDILKIRRSLKMTRKRVTAVEKELHEVKWLQKNCKGGLFTEYSSVKSLSFEVKEGLVAPCTSKSSLELKTPVTVLVKNEVSCDVSNEKTIKKSTRVPIHSCVVKLADARITRQNAAKQELLKNLKKSPPERRISKRIAACRMEDNSISTRTRKKRKI